MRISVSSGVELVEVNDDGDTIAFRMSDAAFERSIADLAKWAGTVRRRNSEIQERMHAADAGSDDYYDAMAALADMPSEAVDIIKELFGDDAVPKVFGTATPDTLAVADFVAQVSDVYAKLNGKVVKDRSESISRYSRHRGDV